MTIINPLHSRAKSAHTHSLHQPNSILSPCPRAQLNHSILTRNITMRCRFRIYFHMFGYADERFEYRDARVWFKFLLVAIYAFTRNTNAMARIFITRAIKRFAFLKLLRGSTTDKSMWVEWMWSISAHVSVSRDWRVEWTDKPSRCDEGLCACTRICTKDGLKFTPIVL